jgi:hypothetical protein
MTWHGYVLQNGLPGGLTDVKKHGAWDAVRKIGIHKSPMPHRNTHGRMQLDFNGYINEAVFEPYELERDYVVEQVADEINVSKQAVENKLIYIVFAPGGTWDESRIACHKYMKEHYKDWEPPPEL